MESNEVDVDEMARELSDAARLASDEMGEWWSVLAALCPRVYDCASTEFRDAFEKQIRDEYDMLKSEWRIVTKKHTFQREVEELLHISEWEVEG